ncbi:hypothetical protein [Krasilnikoviella flava]|uniref:Ig-like domain-containing protein n=1 Tax=Krasilnikoviella flava TaxID=526729 RepID=A0A1T5M1B9_9MICO|nr:hypothetical protein [Krasilnikoviella flava]SKC81598.1 hypothetical protein SAMN04324258_4261 [Krasilnikoviella flava]
MSRGRTVHGNAAAGLGAILLALGLVLGAATSSQAADDTSIAPATENLPGVPAPGSPASEWEAWAAQERADAEATDWAADAKARGCILKDVTISAEVDADYNRAMGAPADLATHRVDLLEECGDAPAQAARAATSGTSTLSLPSGNQCEATSGPGTMCLTKGSGRIYASWQYRGSGSVTGFLRIYRISSGADGCPTGTTWLTGADGTWRSGDTRTISKTRTTAGGYSAHIWKKVTFGHTDWGGACATL